MSERWQTSLPSRVLSNLLVENKRQEFTTFGEIIGPVTPEMRSARQYNVKLFLHNTTVTGVTYSQDSIGFNGVGPVCYLNQGDRVIVTSPTKGVYYISGCISSVGPYNGKTPKVDHKVDERLDKTHYALPPFGAIDAGTPVQKWLGYSIGYVYPLLVRPDSENKINPDTRAGTCLPGNFCLQAPNGSSLTFNVRAPEVVNIESALNHTLGMDKSFEEYIDYLKGQVTVSAQIILHDLVQSGFGNLSQPSSVGSSDGTYTTEPKPEDQKRQQQGQRVREQEAKNKRELDKAKEQITKYYEQFLVQPYEQTKQEWGSVPMGEINIEGISLGDISPAEALQRDRPTEENQRSSGGPFPTIVNNPFTPVVNTTDPKQKSGSAQQDLGGLMQKGMQLLQSAQQFGQKSSQAGVQGGMQGVAGVMNNYLVPDPVRLVKEVQTVVKEGFTFRGFLSVGASLGDARLALACSAIQIYFNPQSAQEVIETLEEVWEVYDPFATLAPYLRNGLIGLANGRLEDLNSFMEKYVGVIAPDFLKIAANPEYLSSWLNKFNSDLGAVVSELLDGSPEGALATVAAYNSGVNWAERPVALSSLKAALKGALRTLLWAKL